MKKTLAASLFMVLSSSAFAVSGSFFSNEATLNQKKIFNELKKFSLSYFVKYNGRSLSDNYQSGATYNRFDGGRSLSTGSRFDTTGSESLYHAFKLSYKLPKNYSLSYSLSYSDRINKNIKYEREFAVDGSKVDTREYGRVLNNHRISLWIPGIYSGTNTYLSAAIFYELPTYKTTRTETENDYLFGANNTKTLQASTEVEFDVEFQYAWGIQPSLAIYSKIPGLYHGVSASYERAVFPDNTPVFTKKPFWCIRSGNCRGISDNRYEYSIQAVRMNIGPYLNYQLTDKLLFKSSLNFDWDQSGDQVGSLNEWGNNMDNIATIGNSYRFNKNISMEGGLNLSIEEASLEKTSLYASLSIRL